MKRACVLPFLLGLVAAVTALAGCSFLMGDPYGDFLQKADKWLDLRAEFQAKAGLTLNDISGIHFAEGFVGATPYRYLFIEGDFTDGSSRIRALGYDNLGLLGFETMPNPGTLTAEADLNGDIKIETNSYFADTLNTHLTSLPVGSDGSWKWLIADSTLAINCMFHVGSSDHKLHMHEHSLAWVAGATPKWVIRGAELWDLAQIVKLDDGRISVLLSQGGGDYNTVIAATYPSFAIFHSDYAGAFDLLSSPDASVSSVIDSYSSNGGYSGPSGLNAWITANGVVSITSGNNNNSITLTRYPLGPGSSLDSYSLSSQHDELLYFEPSGKYWYRFDRGSGRLFRLRTWWK